MFFGTNLTNVAAGKFGVFIIPRTWVNHN